MVAMQNHYQFINLLQKCNSFSHLKQIHALLATSGLSTTDPFAWKLLSVAATATATAASPSGNIEHAHRFFLQIPNPTFFHYNAVIRSFSNTKNPIKSIHLFIQMLKNGVEPDHLTYPFLARASARLSDKKLGGCVHGYVLRNGYVLDLFISNSLIHMYGAFREVGCARKVFDELPMRNLVSLNSMVDGYGKCGEVRLMREVFDVMPERDVVSWSALVDGYVKGGDYAEALAVFGRMRWEGVEANEVTMVSVLCACSHLGALEQGKAMHGYVVEKGLPLTLILRTSIVDMYAKCGAIEEAMLVFSGGSMRKTDVLIWNAMIGGLATHGFTVEALDMYHKLQNLGIKQDEITYLCLLNACAHGGLVKDAWKYFKAITKNGMVPKIEHYACMIDVLARAGHLIDAYQFLCEMPVEPTPSMLGALFNGCINHKKFDLAEVVGKRLIELDPEHDGRYIGLSNVYAVIRRWDEARATREAMESRGVRKIAGYSYVEVFGALHRFIAHDKLHIESKEIYSMLNVVMEHMKLSEKSESLQIDSTLIEEM